MDAKYVVVKNEHLPPAMFVFPPYVDHKSFADSAGGTIISAGFVERGMRCYGRSCSLDVDSDPKRDNALLRMLLRTDAAK